MNILIHSSVTDLMPGFYMTAVEVSSASMLESPGLIQEKEALIAEWKQKSKADIEHHPFIEVYRDFISKLNPGQVISFEGMIRRCLLGGRFPNVNPVVDICNLASVRYGLPIGVFDRSTIKGEVRLRLATSGDRAQLFGQDSVKPIDPGRLVLEDDQGVFGVVGLRDSLRTMVRPDSTEILIVSFGDDRVDPEFLREKLEECGRGMGAVDSKSVDSRQYIPHS